MARARGRWPRALALASLAVGLLGGCDRSPRRSPAGTGPVGEGGARATAPVAARGDAQEARADEDPAASRQREEGADAEAPRGPAADEDAGKGEGVINKKDEEALKKVFEGLDKPVKLVMFTQDTECEFCSVTRGLVEEVAALSDKLTAEVHDFVKDSDLAKKLRVDKIPAVVLLGEKDYGVRFFGVPAGYEFATLVQDILDVSRRDPGLPKEIIDGLAKVDRPVHIQVMVTPTCPYCPAAVRTAHRFAMASDHIVADMVEVTEFPQLAVKYEVQGVPKTVINEEHSVVGAQPEGELLKAVLHAIGK